MDTSSKSKRHNGHSKDDQYQHHHDIEETTHSLLDDGKKVAHSIYKHGMETLDEAQTAVKKYSSGVWSQANKHPMIATVILGGVLGALGTLLFVMNKNK